MKDLAKRAKDGKLKPEEFQGGGFSISNLGMYGIKDFLAVINPPQACILAVGAGEKRPVVKGDEIKIATVMSVSLSTDHRVVDGALGPVFLQEFKRLVEDPLALLLYGVTTSCSTSGDRDERADQHQRPRGEPAVLGAAGARSRAMARASS